MKKSGKLLAIGALITALMVPAGGAIAASSWSGFGVALPPLQQGAYVLHQTKNVVGQAGEINVNSVGGTYKLNARQCRSAGVCGTERFNIGPRSYRTLPSGNKVKAGGTAWLDLHSSTWTVVRVDAVGSWRAN